MEIKDKKVNVYTVETGRMSDKSDRKIENRTNTVVIVEDNDGIFELTFDKDPTNEEIIDKYNKNNKVDKTDELFLLKKEIKDLKKRVKALEGA